MLLGRTACHDLMQAWSANRHTRTVPSQLEEAWNGQFHTNIQRPLPLFHGNWQELWEPRHSLKPFVAAFPHRHCYAMHPFMICALSRIQLRNNTFAHTRWEHILSTPSSGKGTTLAKTADDNDYLASPLCGGGIQETSLVNTAAHSPRLIN